MSTIITFYSYKGGVGRSMALANIAVLLVRRGLRVLAVDWDLEAPGLERYFSYFDQHVNTGGLLPFFSKLAEELPMTRLVQNYKDHTWEIKITDNNYLHLIPSGRETHGEYAKMLEEFDWKDFFSTGGGDIIESLRKQWREDYDFVLIDSRTGMSDIGGICTIQMPDVLVAMFTANEQSMLGVSDIVIAAQRGRQCLAYDRMPLTVLPVLSRFTGTSELQTSSSWLDRFAEHFSYAFEDWLPQWIPPRIVFERLKIPQVDWFSFGELLAVVEQGTSDPASMGFAFERITDLLASDFSDLEPALGSIAKKPLDWKLPERIPALSIQSRQTSEYDLYVSYHRGGALEDWTTRFINELKSWLLLELGAEPRIFIDTKCLAVGEDFSTQIKKALDASKCLLAVITPTYFVSDSCLEEWHHFMKREGINRHQLIFPVLARGSQNTLPEFINHFELFDLSKFFSQDNSNPRTFDSSDYSKALRNLSASIARTVRGPKIFISIRDNDPDKIKYQNMLYKAGARHGLGQNNFAILDSHYRSSVADEVINALKSCSAMIQIHNYISENNRPSTWLEAECLLAKSMNIPFVVIMNKSLVHTIAIVHDTHLKTFENTVTEEVIEAGLSKILEIIYNIDSHALNVK